MTKEMILESIMALLPVLALYLGGIAILVAVVVEGLKAFPKINKIPTKLVVYATSVLLTPLVYIALSAWMKRPIDWYMIFANLMAAFFIAKISMNGWDDIMEIVRRCIWKKDDTGGSS